MTRRNDSEKQGTHFWFMTVFKPIPGGGDVRDFRGTASPKPGATRFDLFDEVRAKVNELDPSKVGGTVIAFDVQPNTL